MVTPVVRRAAVTWLGTDLRLSERRACRVVGMARSSARYTSGRVVDEVLRERLRTHAAQRPRYGYRRLHILLQRDGHAVNHKKLYRLYRAEGLAVRRRRRKRLAGMPRVPLPCPTRPLQRWSMDFVSDTLASGRSFRMLTIIDVVSKQCPAIIVDTVDHPVIAAAGAVKSLKAQLQRLADPVRAGGQRAVQELYDSNRHLLREPGQCPA